MPVVPTCIYINSRRSRDGAFVHSCAIQFALASFYAVHISVLRKEEHACSISIIPNDYVKNSDFILAKLGILPLTRCLRCATDESA